MSLWPLWRHSARFQIRIWPFSSTRCRGHIVLQPAGRPTELLNHPSWYQPGPRRITALRKAFANICLSRPKDFYRQKLLARHDGHQKDMPDFFRQVMWCTFLHFVPRLIRRFRIGMAMGYPFSYSSRWSWPWQSWTIIPVRHRQLQKNDFIKKNCKCVGTYNIILSLVCTKTG